MYKFDVKLGLLASLMALAACSSAPTVTELPNTSDPATEMARVDANINAARTNQVDVLSPENFENATDSMDQAKEYRGKNKDQKTILHEVALSQAYLDKATGVANVANQIIPQVIAERKNALAAGAPKYDGKELTDADKELKKATGDIEDNKTARAQDVRGSLEKRYSDIELFSIRQAKLGDARTTVEQAEKEGAKKFVPKTLAWAQQRIAADDAAITADRHNTTAVEAASTDAKAASARLLNFVRQAKQAAQENPEQLASQFETKQAAAETAATASQQKLDQTQEKLANTNEQLQSKDEAVTALSTENNKLEGKEKLEKQYEAARQQFTSNEAEVYKQGDKLLLRLKGLSFPKDQSVITTDNYPLLTKVQKVIREAGPSTVLVIEGHTDSRGSKAVNEKLSAARAEAVEGYLKANNLDTTDTISAMGFGDSKPIASNKTPRGRAQNRRVDVIINSEDSK